MRVTFKAIALGQRFRSNGVEFVKKTSRTARIVSNKMPFYFGQYEQCIVERGNLDAARRIAGAAK